MSLLTGSHPSEDDLELYAMHRAVERTAEEIEEHLLICESCRSALDEVEGKISVMRIVLGPFKPATYLQ